MQKNCQIVAFFVSKTYISQKIATCLPDFQSKNLPLTGGNACASGGSSYAATTIFPSLRKSFTANYRIVIKFWMLDVGN
jgi:hypothetical protein